MDSNFTEGPFPAESPTGLRPEGGPAGVPAPVLAPAQAPAQAPASGSPSATAQLPVDAIVSTMAQLIFVTTGQAACDDFDELPVQVALTPVVARRVAEALRATLDYPDLATRVAIIDQWQADENPYVPHGRIVIDGRVVRVGIEPLGAGALVTVAWAFVPALILQLEAAAARIR